jgi:PPM family protein phosphatase
MKEFEPQTGRWGSFVSVSRAGPQKDNNEDSVLVLSEGDSDILIVADGAGGLPAAQKASQLSVSVLRKSILTALAQKKSIRDGVMDGIEKANRAVLDLKVGAGTTLLVVEIEKQWVRTFNVGDSIAIAVGQKGKLKFQTHAHSPAGHAVAAGIIDPEDAIHHEDKFTVTQLVGTQDIKIDMTAKLELAPKDTIVVASDGLWDNVEHSVVLDMVRKDNIDIVSESLTQLCFENMNRKDPPGKPDDMSFILYRFQT